MTAAALSIDIISDIVCPWCYIGKRRLEGALKLYREMHPQAPEPEVRWWPFQLNPEMPAEGVDRSTYLEGKFGTARVSDIYARVSGVGKELDIPFAFDKMVRQPNTLAAHSIVAQAGLLGVQDAMVEALFHAYFIEGQDLTQTEVLVRIATGAGLSDADARADSARGQACSRAGRGGRALLHLQSAHRRLWRAARGDAVAGHGARAGGAGQRPLMPDCGLGRPRKLYQ